MTDYATEWLGHNWDTPDKPKVSRETSRAIARSGFGRNRAYGTMANRRNGGSATSQRFTLEELAGRQLVSPSTARVKTQDERGIRVPTQHMAATRKRVDADGESPKSGKIRRTGKYQDAPRTRFQSEDQHIRDITRDKHAKRDIQDIH